MIAAGVPTALQSVHDRVARLFRGGAGGTSRVGAEIELFVAHAATLEPADRAHVEPALRPAPSLHALAALSFEPGGQLELSVIPAGDAHALLARARAALDAIEAACGHAGLVTFACGTDPRGGRLAWDLQCDGARYSVMQAHFDRCGGRGRRMMRQTAALQVCVEIPDGQAGIDAWLSLNAAAPALTAAFANSPVLERSQAAIACNRIAVWLDTDASRTGFDGAQVDDADPVGAYARFALDALTMPLPRRRVDGARRNGDVLSLREWIAAGESRPDGDDIDHHITTLFPPVRPRGEYLEVRCIDALPWRWARAAILLVALIAHHVSVRDVAFNTCVPHDDDPRALWERASRHGPRDPLLAAQATALLTAGEDALRRAHDHDGAGALHDYRRRFTERLRCPGDDLAEMLATTPEALPRWR